MSAKNSQANKRKTADDMKRPFISLTRSLDDPRYQVESFGDRGRATLIERSLVARRHDIVAQRQYHVLRVRHRHNSLRVDSVELVDHRKDRVELHPDLFRRMRIDVDAREMRDPVNVVEC